MKFPPEVEAAARAAAEQVAAAWSEPQRSALVETGWPIIAAAIMADREAQRVAEQTARRTRIPPTGREKDVLDFIKAYQAQHGHVPSYRQIADGVGLGSISGVHRMVRGLERRGHIRRLAGATRAIEVIP